MKYFATVDQQNPRKVALFPEGSIDPLPEGSFEIPEADYWDFQANQGFRQFVDGKMVKVDPEPLPPPPTIVAKVDLYRKLTDAEFAAMQQGVAQQPPRIQGIFNAAVNFRSDAPEWDLLKQMATELFGAGRAAELLTP